MASTILDNMGYKQEWLERQFAHEEQNKIKAAYKRDVWRMYLPKRKAMMQASGRLPGQTEVGCRCDSVEQSGVARDEYSSGATADTPQS